jgi:hypothetical protein
MHRIYINSASDEGRIIRTYEYYKRGFLEYYRDVQHPLNPNHCGTGVDIHPHGGVCTPGASVACSTVLQTRTSGTTKWGTAWSRGRCWRQETG